MSIAVLNHFIGSDGISVACSGDQHLLTFAFDASIPEADRERWKQVFETTQSLMKVIGSSEDELKISLNSQTLVLRRNQNVYLGVVAMKGHPVVKSLQRMIRRGFKKLGAPIAPARPRTSAPAPAPTPTSPTPSTAANDGGNGPTRPI